MCSELQCNPAPQHVALLEVCAATIGSVIAANRGGAHRIELCSALGEGGLTPSIGFAMETRRISQIPINVLVRPRSGDFLYTESELFVMERDIKALAELELADGIVIGCLRADGAIDREACERLIAASGGRLSLTFHRAFDMCANPQSALEEIIDMGFDRVLTSGCAASAPEGVPMLASLVQQAAGRIVVMPGAGINADNARHIVEATGATEIHASASAAQPSEMLYRHQGVNMGEKGADEYAHRATRESAVRAIVNSLLID